MLYKQPLSRGEDQKSVATNEEMLYNYKGKANIKNQIELNLHNNHRAIFQM